MAYPKCVLKPDANGYSRKPGNEVISQQLDGGAARYRRDIMGATNRVGVQWTVTAMGYKYLESLYVITESGSLPFLIDLIMSEDTYGEHEARIVPGTYGLIYKRGNVHIVGAELEVVPDEPNVVAAQDFFDTYNEFGEDWSPLEGLDALVNLTLADDLLLPGDTGSLPI